MKAERKSPSTSIVPDKVICEIENLPDGSQITTFRQLLSKYGREAINTSDESGNLHIQGSISLDISPTNWDEIPPYDPEDPDTIVTRRYTHSIVGTQHRLIIERLTIRDRLRQLQQRFCRQS